MRKWTAGPAERATAREAEEILSVMVYGEVDRIIQMKVQRVQWLVLSFASYMKENQKEKPQGYLIGNPNQPPQLSS